MRVIVTTVMFAFAGRAYSQQPDIGGLLPHGETWVFDCAAARLGSQLQPIIELRDSAGGLILQASDDNPRLVRRITTAGRYTVTVRDARSQGGPGHCYRLAAGKIPALLEY